MTTLLPLIACAVVVILVAASCWGCCQFERLEAREAARRLWEYWQNHPERVAQSIPAKLLGVFWFSDNPAPELVVTFEGEVFDPERRTLTLDAYMKYSWSIDTNCLGYLFYLLLAVIGRSVIIFHWNEDFTFAEMKLYIFYCIPLPACLLRFTIRQLDAEGNSWERKTEFFGRYSEYGSYTLRKIIDQAGKELPAFKDMEKSVDSGEQIKGTTVKTKVQALATQTLWPGIPSKPKVSSESEGLLRP
eukprot:TRINITY_DN108358_c0_g1_i1.p1 TRINITY_DN108358_c0_g1~~TRINITY_DN108358_c0_g1_i1.p1  ORF type:complete len:246 (-),score=50.83 TRINITY_DN108358_c0_g1_i1:40-777(-)